MGRKRMTKFCRWQLDHGLPSQQDIASRAGIAPSTISLYVYGRRTPTLAHATAIAGALRAMGYVDVTVGDLFPMYSVSGEPSSGDNASGNQSRERA